MAGEVLFQVFHADFDGVLFYCIGCVLSCLSNDCCEYLLK